MIIPSYGIFLLDIEIYLTDFFFSSSVSMVSGEIHEIVPIIVFCVMHCRSLSSLTVCSSVFTLIIIHLGILLFGSNKFRFPFFRNMHVCTSFSRFVEFPAMFCTIPFHNTMHNFAVCPAHFFSVFLLVQIVNISVDLSQSYLPLSWLPLCCLVFCSRI